MDRPARSYRDFWPHYLREHRRPATRGFHYAATLLGLALAVLAAVLGRWWLLLVAVVVAYGLAWFAHLTIERNRPATFRHPLWSFVSDFRMLALFVTGRLGPEIARLDANEQGEKLPPRPDRN